jgi:hypothetical protein
VWTHGGAVVRAPAGDAQVRDTTGAGDAFCDDGPMSRRDLAHIMDALWDRSAGRAGVGIAVADLDVAIGRGRNDMRTPLNLHSLLEEGHVEARDDGSWALTPEGIDWLRQQRELSDR